MVSKRLAVGVLYGGFSTERQISIKSGRAVADALRQAGYNVVEVDVKSEHLDGVCRDVDVVFVALHGKFGEDGGIQEMLEKNRIRYTGSGPEASYVCMDKIATKRLLRLHKIRTPVFRVVQKYANPQILRQMAEEIGYPVVVKPSNQGSSIGVKICDDFKALLDGVVSALEFSDLVIVEKYIYGREVTVGILGKQALPVIELRPERRFFDYDAKYKDPNTRYIVNPPLGENAIRKIQRAALRAHRVLCCRGFSRVDMIYSDDGKPYVLEVNTIPGLTERSLLPKAAEARGIDFVSLCRRIIKEAMVLEE
jgi:D-alanine-D-alanine ligase